MRNHSSASMLAKLWGFNIILLIFVFTAQFGADFFKSSVLEYSNVKADPFDGTVTPIAYVPNWLTTSTQNKTLRFDDVALSDFVELPQYNADLLADSDSTNKMAVLERAQYLTPYMGSYRMNYLEYDGSHLAVDIRAPLGTPVRSIANGVVVKVNDKETSDGKYVIIRHENVTYNGETENLYSEYLHLESTNIEVGTKVKKGQVIGKVGMTGITTTPHLHLQIDKENAPFRVYWPYSTKDLADLGINFFEAVNRGIGKENAIKYTIHPLEFIQEFENGNTAESKETIVTASTTTSTPETPSTTPSTPVVETTTPPVVEQTPVAEEVPSWTATADQPFSDILPGSLFYNSTKYLFSQKITTGLPDGTFRAGDMLSRRGAVLFLGRAYKVQEKEYDMLPFSDISATDSAAGYLGTMVDQGIVSAASQFRPEDNMTRGEAIILLVRLAKLPVNGGISYFRDVSKQDVRAQYFNAFSKKMGLKRNLKLSPNTTISRGEFANMLVGILTK